eukprot:15466013-Alexandrium_andersonii.AAC.1
MVWPNAACSLVTILPRWRETVRRERSQPSRPSTLPRNPAIGGRPSPARLASFCTSATAARRRLS